MPYNIGNLSIEEKEIILPCAEIYGKGQGMEKQAAIEYYNNKIAELMDNLDYLGFLSNGAMYTLNTYINFRDNIKACKQ